MRKFFYNTIDGLKIKAYQYGKKRKHQTVILYLRGGNNHPVHKGDMELTTTDFIGTWLDEAVKNDKCIVYATDYRGSDESDGKDDISYDDVKDIQGLFDWVRKNHSKYKKLIMYAESMGVYKALSFCSRYTKYIRLIDTIVLKAGVYNLVSMKKFRPYLYGHWIEDYNLSMKDIKKRDEFIRPSKLKKIPLFIFHGTKDIRAPIDEMYLFISQLENNYSLQVFNQGNHGLSKFQNEMYNTLNNILK